jgi:cytochrome c peroxidase
MFLLAAALAVQGCANDTAHGAGAPAASVREHYLTGIDRLDSALALMERGVKEGDDLTRLRGSFLAARLAYKRIEYLAEYHAPATARGINGPVVDEVEEGDPNQKVVPPEGLQVIEEMLWSTPPAPADTIAMELAIVRANVRRLRTYAKSVGMSDGNVFEAMRREMIRITALGLAGFDVSTAGSAIPEAGAALESLRDALASYGPELESRFPLQHHRLDSLLRGAVASLQGSSDFLSFDRLRFIRLYANPIMARLREVRDALGIPPPVGRNPLAPMAATMFDRDAFDPSFFAPEYALQGEGGSGERIELGRLLFFDPILSGNGRRACASCHQPERAFTDGEAKSIAFDSKGSARRNAPTLINAALQRELFYDRHVSYLEDQAKDVLTNTREMHGSLADAVTALSGSAEYRKRFAAAFGEGERGITERNLRVALASYIRSLRSADSPFDRYVRGESAEFPADARRGFTIFMGKGKCGTCHFMPLFNGTVPPMFEVSESEIIGVPERFDTSGAKLDPDEGRFGATGIAIDRFAFRTPTLRNVALTAPYMHNGALATLEDVVEFYDRGGGAGLGIEMPRQTLSSEPLHLTPEEKADLISFLKSLTDTSGTTTRPARLPEIGAYAARRVGGEY